MTMRIMFALLLCIHWRTTYSGDCDSLNACELLRSPDRPESRIPKPERFIRRPVIGSDQCHPNASSPRYILPTIEQNRSRVLRLDVPGRFVDVAYKSFSGDSGLEIVVVKEFEQDELIPTLSKDFHPDHRSVSHHQLYIQSSVNASWSRQAIGPPIDGNSRSGHTYYMASSNGDYILSSSMEFSDPLSEIRVLLTWTRSELRQEISLLGYHFENDCRVHHGSPGRGMLVTSLPHFDCPWVVAVPSLTGSLIALLKHETPSETDPYQLNIEFLTVAPDQIVSIFETKIDLRHVQCEDAVFYHWSETDTFRIYGGTLAFEVCVEQQSTAPIVMNVKMRTRPRTSSSRIAYDGKTRLVLDAHHLKEIPIQSLGKVMEVS